MEIIILCVRKIKDLSPPLNFVELNESSKKKRKPFLGGGGAYPFQWIFHGWNHLACKLELHKAHVFLWLMLLDSRSGN